MASVKPRPGYGYEVRYVDPATGKRPSKTFKLKKDADAYRRKVEREIEDGNHTADAETKTVGEAADEFIEWNRARERDGRIGYGRLYALENVVRVHIKPILGGIRLKDLTGLDVERFYEAQVAKWSAVGSRKKVGEFKLIEEFAVKRGYTKRLVTPDVLKSLRGLPPTRIRTFSPEQVNALLASSSTLTGRSDYLVRPQFMMRCAVHLAAFSGLRRGEILGLTLDNIDLDNGVLQVRHSLTQWDELKAPKTAAGYRDVPVPAIVCDMIREWIARYYIQNDRKLIFRGATGGLVAVADFQHRYWRLLGRAGLGSDRDRFHFHALRHFAASWMIHHGLPLTDVAALLGHSKFDMTLQVYAHPVTKPAMQRATIERMVTQMPALHDAPLTQPAGKSLVLNAF